MIPATGKKTAHGINTGSELLAQPARLGLLVLHDGGAKALPLALIISRSPLLRFLKSTIAQGIRVAGKKPEVADVAGSLSRQATGRPGGPL
jgi:hypothetical protein